MVGVKIYIITHLMVIRRYYFRFNRHHLLFQVIVCSATLHSFDVKKLSERIMHFPTWVDLKGEDSVPETVHHVVVPVNPKSDRIWERLGKNHIRVSPSCAGDSSWWTNYFRDLLCC